MRLRGKTVFVLAFGRVAPVLSAAVFAIFAANAGAHAQGKLEAHYIASIAGIAIGQGSWVIDISDDHYTAAASGVTTGLVRVFTGGQGTSAAHGRIVAGEHASSVYASTIKTSRKTDEVRLTVKGGVIREAEVKPPVEDDPQRIPVTREHHRGIVDPMTAALLRTPGTGDPLSSAACHRTLPIFDGRVRYDLQLAFKRMDSVKAQKGYHGPVVVCAVYFKPIAGFVPSRAAVRYLARQRDMEIWLAPIEGTRVLVPFRAQGPTPIGLAVLQAVQFVSTASPKRASADGTKTQ
ncbi:MAG TPA: DUF3108 domain-containing protein [Pseudolabrys sp.]|nr:DUF3108 domain-containing protein [Pseudolabrys sp.]